MKNVWNSIFQTVSESVKTLSESVNKKARHDVVLMTTGFSVVTLLTFTAGDLSGNGQNAMVAFAETHTQVAAKEMVLEETVPENINLDELMIGEEHIETETSIEKLLLDVTEESVLEAAVVAAETEEAVVEEEYPDAEQEEEAVSGVETETVPEETEIVEETEAVSDEIVLSQDEYTVLLKIVQAEAGTCDEDGKLLVANVILNRVECNEFPDTIREVVYQKSQFSPVIDGSINTCKITEETENAVSRALKGEDISEGALYFMNRKKSASKNVRWFDTKLEFLFKHGEHEFFK